MGKVKYREIPGGEWKEINTVVVSGKEPTWGNISGDIENQDDLYTSLNEKVDFAYLNENYLTSESTEAAIENYVEANLDPLLSGLGYAPVEYTEQYVNQEISSLNIPDVNNAQSNSTTDAYSCDYSNTHFTTLLDVYPVGSIYMSVNNTDPKDLFGGTWEQIKDKFILSAGDTYGAGTTGGSATHNHGLGAGFAMANAQGGSLWFQEKQTSTWYANGIRYVTNGSSGSNQNWGWQLGGTTDNATSLPPYLSVYVWKRTA